MFLNSFYPPITFPRAGARRLPKPDLGRSRCDDLAVSRPQSTSIRWGSLVPEPGFFMHAIAWSSASGVTDHPQPTAASQAFFAVTSNSQDRQGRCPAYLDSVRRRAPSGTRPVSKNRHRATMIFRATATIAIRRTRPLASPTRSRNHWLIALSGWCISQSQASSTA